MQQRQTHYQLNKPVHSKLLHPIQETTTKRPGSAVYGEQSKPANKNLTRKSSKKLFSSSNAKKVAQFFDDEVTQAVYGGNNHNDSTVVAQTSIKKYGVVVNNGQLTVNPQVLKDECEQEFEKKWFLKENQDKLLIDRTAKTDIFEVDKSLSTIPMILPRSELDPKRDQCRHSEFGEQEDDISDPLQTIDPYYSGQLKTMSVESGVSAGQVSVASNQHSELLSVARLLDDFDASVYSAPYLNQNAKLALISSNRPSTAPNVLRAIGGGESESHRMRQLILEKQKKSLKMLYRSKSGKLRPNNPVKTVTPDYVLFIEALRRDILLYPSESVDNNKSMVNHENSLEDDLDTFDMRASMSNVPNGQRSFNIQGSGNHSGIVEEIHHKEQSFIMTSTIDSDVLVVQNSRILSLDLCNRGIGSDRGQCLAVALQYCPHLQILKLKNNRLDDITLSVIIQAAFGFAQLQYLDISENDLNKQTCGVFCRYIECIESSENDGMGVSYSSRGNTLENSIISNHSSTKCTLEYVNMNKCNIGDDLSGKIAKSLIDNDTIRELHMSSNRIGSEESQASLVWSELIQKNQSLVALNLSHNFFRRYSAQLLLKSLHYNRSLVYLNLSNNQVSDHDAIVSAPFLEKNTCLQSLDLSFNMIENKGCIALSYCLSQLSCVNFTHLNLLNNKIGDIGFKFTVERMLFILHQNYELHYAIHHQENNKSLGVMGNSKKPLLKPSTNSSKSNKTTNETSLFDELYSMDNDSDKKRKNAEKVPADIPSTAIPPKIYRLLTILCQPVKNSDRVAISSWSATMSSAIQFNSSELGGKHEFQLSDAFDHIRARICMDAIEQNPCIAVKEFKWYNDVVKGYEYPSITRQIYSNMNKIKPLFDAINQVCSEENRALSKSTPSTLYKESYPEVIMTDPFDKAHNLITLLYKLIHLLNKSTEEKMKASYLMDVKTVLVDLGHRLSLNLAGELMFFLLDKWHRLDALHSRYRIGEIYQPWKQQVKEGSSMKSSKILTKSNSVYQDIEDALKKEQEKNVDQDVLISDPIVILKFLVCSIYDYVLSRSTDMNIQQFYLNQHLFGQAQLLAAKHITLQKFSNINNQNTKSTHKVASAFEVYPPDHDKVQMNSYELLVRMITELTFQYNNSTGISAAAAAMNGEDHDVHNKVPKKVFELPTNKHSGLGKKAQEPEEEEVLQDPIEECFVHATQFLQYILLQIQSFTMISCPYQSMKIISNSIPDVRNDLPSHGTLTLDMYVPSMQSNFHKAFSSHRHYLFDAFLTVLSYDHAVYDPVHILYQTKNDTNKLFNNVVNLTNNLLQILEYDDNILHLTCEQAELVLKVVFAAKKGYHMHGIERLLFQIANVNEARRFIIRNCYFHEIVWLRKKMNYLFKVLIGNVNGHYILDLSDHKARLAVGRLAAVHNEQLYLVQNHIQSNKPSQGQSFKTPGTAAKKSTFTAAVDMEAIPSPSIVSQDIDQLFFRNPSYNGSYLAITSEWLQQLPSVGKLRFDYVSFLEPLDFMSHLFPVSVLSHTNINGATLLETTLFHERYHQMYGNAFGSCLNTFGVQDALFSTSSTSGSKGPIDHAFNRVYNNTYQLVLRNQKHHYHTNDERLFQAELLKKEGYADSIVQQMFLKDVYKLSQKIYKKLKIPPKNSAVYDLNDPECREYVKRLRSIERANAAAKPVTKQNDVLNIMMRRYYRPALGGYGNNSNNNNVNNPPSVADSTTAPQKDSSAAVPMSGAGSVMEGEDEDEEDDDDMDSDNDDDQSVSKKTSEAEKKKAAALAALAEEPANPNVLSRESYFRLQDQSSNLDTGARQAFFMRGLPNNQERPSSAQNTNSVKTIGFETPTTVLTQNGIHVDKAYEMQSLCLWKDYLETTWSSYNVCHLEYTIKKAQAIFAMVQKENSHSYQYHYSVGTEKDGFPDEVLLTDHFLQLAKTPLQHGIVFNINGGKRRKTHMTMNNSEHLKTPQKKNSSIIGTSSPGTNKASFTSATDLLTPVALQCGTFELNLLILETCCLFNIRLEVVQVKSILEALKSQKAPQEVMVRTISIVWKYVVDRENLPQCVKKVCGESTFQDCVHRFGYLHFWSPLHPEGKYDFDLTDRQHRDVLSIIASLLLEDETLEAVDCQYQPSRVHPFEPVNIDQFSIAPPHSIGTRVPITKQSKIAQTKGRPSTSKGQGSSANSKEVQQGVAFSSDFKTGKLTMKVKAKPYQVPSQFDANNGSTMGIPSQQSVSVQDTSTSNVPKLYSAPQDSGARSYPIEAIARQQAVRRVYCLYKQSLIEQYVLLPFMEETTAAKNAMSPQFAHILYPITK